MALFASFPGRWKQQRCAPCSQPTAANSSCFPEQGYGALGASIRTRRAGPLEIDGGQLPDRRTGVLTGDVLEATSQVDLWIGNHGANGGGVDGWRGVLTQAPQPNSRLQVGGRTQMVQDLQPCGRPFVADQTGKKDVGF